MSPQKLETKLLEEQQNLLTSEDDDREVLHRKRPRRDYRTVLLGALGMVSGIVIGALIGFMFSTGSKEACIRSVISGCKYWSKPHRSSGSCVHSAPLLEDLDISYKMVRFNGSLMKENVFREKAGPEVDAAWASLGVNCKHLPCFDPFRLEVDQCRSQCSCPT